MDRSRKWHANYSAAVDIDYYAVSISYDSSDGIIIGMVGEDMAVGRRVIVMS